MPSIPVSPVEVVETTPISLLITSLPPNTVSLESPAVSLSESVDNLRTRLFAMGTAVEELVRDSTTALTTQNMVLAATIIPRDDMVDQMEVDMEALCLRLLERPQSGTYDVRLVSTALKVITDIERIGDHAVDIARVAQRMEREMIVYKPLVDIPRVSEMARTMLHDALNAFLYRDLALAKRTIHADEAVDRLYGRMRRDLQQVLQTQPNNVLQASYLLFVNHYIERMCDHCVGIAERVFFLETGQLHSKR